MSKKIFLSNGIVTLISDIDFIYLAGFTWHLENTGCVRGWIDSKMQLISRIIAKKMGLDLTNFIDHKDRNPLNNQRNNLRAATHGQNQSNSIRTNKSGFKGVKKNGNGWEAQIKTNDEKIYLGLFKTPEEAHDAYCEAAVKYHKEFANFG